MKGRCPGPLDEWDVTCSVQDGAYTNHLFGICQPILKSLTKDIHFYKAFTLSIVIPPFFVRYLQPLRVFHLDLGILLREQVMVIVAVLGGIFIVALIMVMVVYARQQNEKKSIEQQRRIRMLADRGRQMQLLIEEIPPHYISSDFRVFVADQWLELLQEQQELGCKEARIKAEIEIAQNKLQEIRSSNQPKPEPLTDLQSANGVRRNLKQLNKIVIGLYQERKISHRVAQGYINEVKIGFTQTLVEVFRASARKAELEGNDRIAVVHYKRIMSELNRNNPNGIHNQTLLECRQTIADLEEKIAIQSEQNDNQLASSVDEMIEDAESWKKKQVYDN